MILDKTCDKNHPFIGYLISESKCPLCKALNKVEDLQIQRKILEDIVDDLNEQM